MSSISGTGQDAVQQIRDLLLPLHKKLDKLDAIESNMNSLETEVRDIKTNVSGIGADLKVVKTDMVTKSYLETSNSMMWKMFKIEFHQISTDIAKAVSKAFKETIDYFREKDVHQDKQLEDHEKRLSKLEFSYKN